MDGPALGPQEIEMATQVNTKFVVKLTVALVAGSAVLIGAFAYLMKNTGADLARMGDKHMLAAHYKDAAEAYSKAVNKEKTNSEFLKKWIESLRKQTPETQTSYKDAYENLGRAMRQLAVCDRDNVAAQREYLDIEKQVLESGPVRRDSLDAFIRECQTLIEQHVGSANPGAAEPLRRYRGWARLRVATESQDAGPEYADGAKEDLEAALKADPADSETARLLERFYAYKAAKADAASKPEEVTENIAKGSELISSFLARTPNDPMMLLVQLRRDLELAAYEQSKRTDKPDLKALNEKFREIGKPKLEAAAAAAMAIPPAQVDRQLIQMLRQMESVVDPDARQSRSEALTRAVSAAHPGDAEVFSILAEILESRDDHAGGVAALQKIVDMPDKPLSFEGATLYDRKPDALMRQAMWTVRQWQTLQMEPEKNAAASKEAAAKAREIRDKLAALRDPNSAPLILLDAELAYIDGDYRLATRLLERFEKDSNYASPDALLIGAQVAMRLNEPGTARQRLRGLLNVQPTNVRAALILAGLDAQMQEYEEAEELYKRILRLMPDNKKAEEGLKLVQAIVSKGVTKVDDPIIQTIIDADAMSKDTTKPNGGERAAALLREKIQAIGQDPRMVRALVVILANNNNRAGALEAARAGLAAHPESKDLQLLTISLGEENPMEQRLALIAGQDMTEVQRLTERYVTYKMFAKKDLALAELDKALKLGPNDNAVLELVFMQALEDKDYAKATELTARAQKEDLDKAGGATYRARLESAQGRIEEAVRIMEELVKAGGAQAESWRLLGRLQNSARRSADAVKSFAGALAIRPNDIPTIKDLLKTQIVMAQNEDALKTARQYKTWAQNDPEFVNYWLSLEAGLGNRQMVIDERERLAKQNPGDKDNLMSLAALYMDNNQRPKAREILDGIRAKKDDLDAVNLDAGWYWAERQPEKARSIFEAFIAAQEKGPGRLQPLLVYAQFLGQRQDAAGALAVLDQAREFQTKGVSEVDKIIGDTYMAMRREDDAIVAFKRVIDEKADTSDQVYLKRMIEAMIGQKRFAEADALLNPMLPLGQPNSVALLLAADSKAGQGDQRARRQLLDRAVAQFPSEPMVFVKRGQSRVPEDIAELERLRKSQAPQDAAKLQEVTQDIQEAKKDFDRALQLQPDLWAALRLRANAYDLLGDTEASINDIRAALLANPSDTELLRGMITYYVQNNREADGDAATREIIKRRPGDPSICYAAGNAFAGLGKFETGGQFMAMAFEIDQQDAIAQRYLDCLLAVDPPKVAEAARILDKLGPKRISTNAGMLMAQAKVQLKMGRAGAAAQASGDALRLLNADNPRDMLAWYTEAQKLESDPKKLLLFLEDLSQLGVAKDWLLYFRANLSLTIQDPTAQRSGESMLVGLLKDKESTSVPIRQACGRKLGEVLYGQRRFDEAAKVMRDTLTEFPKDAESMNNLAYLLAKDLKKPTEALPLAQQAATLNPKSAEVLDTLGLVQLLLGNVDESVSTLTKALPLAQSAFAAATVSVHLADALWTQGKKEPARTAMEQAADILSKQGPAANPQTKADLDELRKKITGP
jgi:Tfp pilus assembly protein PilF